MVPRPIQGQRQILEDLATRPGPRILLPSVGERSQVLGRGYHPHTIDKSIVLGGEVVVDQQARDLAVF
jgi:hypothetical protein